MSKHGEILRHDMLHTLKAIEKLELEPTYNVFEDKRYIRGVKLIDDELGRKVRLDIRLKYDFQPSDKMVLDMLHTAAERNPVNPPKDYLEGLEWDGKPRIDRILY